MDGKVDSIPGCWILHQDLSKAAQCFMMGNVSGIKATQSLWQAHDSACFGTAQGRTITRQEQGLQQVLCGWLAQALHQAQHGRVVGHSAEDKPHISHLQAA